MGRRNAIYSKNHQERFGVEKRTKNSSGEELFAGIAPFDLMRRSQEMQMLLYEAGDLDAIKEFFDRGGCFLQKVQRQITVDNNLTVLKLFLKYWEYIPTERSYMIKNASLDFIETYMLQKDLGKQGEEFARCGRIPKQFVARFADRLNSKAKEICRGFRHIDVD